MSKGMILVADDDAAIRTVLNQALSRAGYEVRVTSNAATLWRWVSAGEGDLVITDVVMPDENAFDMLPRIKKAAAGTAGHRHERAEHIHDGDAGIGKGRLRISSQAVRPDRTGRHHRAGAVGAEGRRTGQRQGRAAGDDAADRPLAPPCRTFTACWRG